MTGLGLAHPSMQLLTLPGACPLPDDDFAEAVRITQAECVGRMSSSAHQAELAIPLLTGTLTGYTFNQRTATTRLR